MADGIVYLKDWRTGEVYPYRATDNGDGTYSHSAVLAAGDEVAGGFQFVDENGVLYGVKHVDNKPRVSSTPYYVDIAKGNVPNHEEVHRFGHNDAVGATNETVWEYGGLYTYSAAAATMYISSSAGGDTQSYLVTGLDANWDRQTQLVTAQGLTKTEIGTGLTWIRIFDIDNQGTTNNAGDVYVYEDDTLTAGEPDTASKVRAKMEVGENISHAAMYAVPNGYTFYLLSWSGSESATKATNIDLWVRPFGMVFKQIHRASIKDNPFGDIFQLPLQVAAMSDIEIRASTSVGAGIAMARFEGWIEL